MDTSRIKKGFAQLDHLTDHLEFINEPSLQPSRLQIPPVLPGNEKLGTEAAIASSRTGSESVVRLAIRARAERLNFLPPELFGEPAWDMLLDLYLSDILSRRTSISDLCGASQVAPTTALRWIEALHREGLVERRSDPRDGRRCFISLSAAGLVCMDRYFESLA